MAGFRARVLRPWPSGLAAACLWPWGGARTEPAFRWTAVLTLRKLKYPEGVTEAAAEIDADFHVVGAALAGLLDNLIEAFGGEKTEK